MSPVLVTSSGAVDSAIASVALGATAADLESKTLDFKQPARSAKDTLRILADAAACFANARGGDVALGVVDRASRPDAFVGVPLDLTVDVIRKGILFDIDVYRARNLLTDMRARS